MSSDKAGEESSVIPVLPSHAPQKVIKITRHVEYAPARGKKVMCSGSCGTEIARGRLRIREEYNAGTSRKWHLECYPSMFTVEELGGFDKIKEGDQDIVKSKSEHSPQMDSTTTKTTSPTSNKKSTSSTTTSPQSNTTPLASAATPSTSVPFAIGAHIMAKVQTNHVGKNVWFAAKIVSVKKSTTIPDTLDVQVCYDDDNVKEWVPQHCIAPLVSDEAPDIAQFQAGVHALGYRRKPGSSVGWWYSVKVLRYLSDVPGAFVQWQHFPFPDSILEKGQIQPATYPPPSASQDKQARKRGADDIDDDTVEKKARREENDGDEGAEEIVHEQE